MTYTDKLIVVSKYLRPFSVHRLKLVRLKRDEKINAVNMLYKFISRNLDIGIEEFDGEDIGDILDTAAKGIVVREDDDSQYFQRDIH